MLCSHGAPPSLWEQTETGKAVRLSLCFIKRIVCLKVYRMKQVFLYKFRFYGDKCWNTNDVTANNLINTGLQSQLIGI